ncbi:dihydropteroate synthase [Sulfobacillus sp. hq2]|uniref:dihydropteroate synthase n=1 Tax=Sulfobacillus TaxID=28033 RepID=UPI001FA86BD4|nr:dihydropteroate synthase [Sulfobacillus sp. hq2]
MESNPRIFRCGTRPLHLGSRTYVMGIVNVTPDSFSDGGRYDDPVRAVDQTAQLIADGADIIDVGAESTRPGYQPVDVETEWRRLEEPLRQIRARWPAVRLSVDTQKAEVARRAIALGVDIINDIQGFQGDPEMIRVLADSNAGYIMMFNRPVPWPDGVVDLGEMEEFFVQGLQRARAYHIADDRILLDPGLGFAYSGAASWTVLRHLPALSGMGAGLLLGPSRKRFLGTLTGKPPVERDVATATVCAIAAMHHVDVMRVHNVALTRDAVAVADRWQYHE